MLATVAVPARAQERETPYWASIRATVLNMRVGPSADYKIDWVYRRPGLPVKVVRVMEGWRLIEDPDGARGWVVARLLSPERGAIVIGEGLAELRDGPSHDAMLKWRVEPGVVGALGGWTMAGASSASTIIRAISCRTGCGARANPEGYPPIGRIV